MRKSFQDVTYVMFKRVNGSTSKNGELINQREEVAKNKNNKKNAFEEEVDRSEKKFPWKKKLFVYLLKT